MRAALLLLLLSLAGCPKAPSEGSLEWVDPAEYGGTEAVVSLWDQHSKEGLAS